MPASDNHFVLHTSVSVTPVATLGKKQAGSHPSFLHSAESLSLKVSLVTGKPVIPQIYLCPELFSKLRTHVKSGDKRVGCWLSLLLRGTLASISPPKFLKGYDDLALGLFAYLFPDGQFFLGRPLTILLY